MRATLVKPLKNKNKIITGTVIQKTFDKLIMVVIDKNGSSSIKRFKIEDYSITYEI